MARFTYGRALKIMRAHVYLDDSTYKLGLELEDALGVERDAYDDEAGT